jgi:transposase
MVELSHGARVSIYNSASPTMAAAVIKALAR